MFRALKLAYLKRYSKYFMHDAVMLEVLDRMQKTRVALTDPPQSVYSVRAVLPGMAELNRQNQSDMSSDSK